jgi:hypothetical protein
MKRKLVALGACAALLLPAVTGAAVTEENFHLRTTNDLVALCSADASDPLVAAAVNFCHGFGVGVYQVLREEAAARPQGPQLFCVPNPTPSRNSVVLAFVRWAGANPGEMRQPPAEGFVRFLAQQYPCRASSR